MASQYSVNSDEYAKFERSERRKAENKAAKKLKSEEINLLWADLNTKLTASLNDLEGNYNWAQEQRVPNGNGYLDILGTNRLTGELIGIELEKARQTAVRNVNKVWIAMDKTEISFTLVHIFSPRFEATDALKRIAFESKFIGQKAQEALGTRLKYHHIILNTWPLEDPNLPGSLAQDVSNLLPKSEN